MISKFGYSVFDTITNYYRTLSEITLLKTKWFCITWQNPNKLVKAFVELEPELNQNNLNPKWSESKIEILDVYKNDIILLNKEFSLLKDQKWPRKL